MKIASKEYRLQTDKCMSKEHYSSVSLAHLMKIINLLTSITIDIIFAMPENSKV